MQNISYNFEHYICYGFPCFELVLYKTLNGTRLLVTKLVLIKVEIASTEYFVDQIVDQQNIWLTKEV